MVEGYIVVTVTCVVPSDKQHERETNGNGLRENIVHMRT